jgi:toxin ParE1/3/4
MRRAWLTRSAQKDLDAIWDYVVRESQSFEIASAAVDVIIKRFPALDQSPHIGRHRDDFGSGIRSFPAGNYIIYYREVRGRLHILRVIHAKRDQKSAFFEKPH